MVGGIVLWRTLMCWMMVWLAGMMMTMGAMAQGSAVQTGSAQAKGMDDRTAEALSAQANTLLEQARKTESGNVAVTLEKYPAHFTMLSVRVKSGGAEVHVLRGEDRCSEGVGSPRYHNATLQRSVRNKSSRAKALCGR